MKRLLTILLLALYSIPSLLAQDVDWEKRMYITLDFQRTWTYFRMLKNPLLSYEETHNIRNLNFPQRLLMPEKFTKEDYVAELKISRYKSKFNQFFDHEVGKWIPFVNIGADRFYLVEKEDGLLGVKRNYITDEILDSMQLNIYDSIFPFDNRFLAVYFGKNTFIFQSGNVTWGTWLQAGFMRRVDYVGAIRGVQFGVEGVRPFSQEESDRIRLLRPKYPDYVYAHAHRSLLSKFHLLIAAPEGKEDQLVEFIYYTSDSTKTGDPNPQNYYEMRYIVPTEIKSIKERRQEKRLLSPEEKEIILEINNQMLYFVEVPEVPYTEAEDEIIIRASQQE